MWAERERGLLSQSVTEFPAISLLIPCRFAIRRYSCWFRSKKFLCREKFPAIFPAQGICRGAVPFTGE